MPKLLLATNNKGKVREYKSLLQGIPYEIVTMAEQGITIEVEEVGETLEEKAGVSCFHDNGWVAWAKHFYREDASLPGDDFFLSKRKGWLCGLLDK